MWVVVCAVNSGGAMQLAMLTRPPQIIVCAAMRQNHGLLRSSNDCFAIQFYFIDSVL